MAISTKDRKLLHDRGGGECAFPRCVARERLVEAHIVARSPDGPRGDAAADRKALDRYENLILLCPTHHDQVDARPDKWPAQALRRMKQEHERGIAGRSSRMTSVQGEVSAVGQGVDKVTGAKVRQPTRFLPGTRISAEGTDAREVTGLEIGGEGDG